MSSLLTIPAEELAALQQRLKPLLLVGRPVQDDLLDLDAWMPGLKLGAGGLVDGLARAARDRVGELEDDLRRRLTPAARQRDGQRRQK